MARELLLILADNESTGNHQGYFHVGEILAAHGVRGEIKARLLSSDPQRLASLADCFLADRAEKNFMPVRITGSRKAKGAWILSIKGITDRDAAEKLRGCLLSVRREDAITLGQNEWFIDDLIGCEVMDRSHGYLGNLVEIIENPAHDIYMIRSSGEKDLLFPALKSIILDVDLETKKIMVDLPEGLYEIYREQQK